MSSNLLQVDFPRLKSDVEALAAIGRADDQGIYRMAFSEGDMQARSWLQERIVQAGLELYQDGAANLFGRLAWDPDKPSVMVGSHIDTVPGAGHLDGALGVLCGLEALRSMKEQGISLKRPLELVAFSDEEGRFSGMFGSQALCGDISPQWIHAARDLSGMGLTEAMAAQGLDATEALSAARSPESLHAFVELHIEQGPVLDELGSSIGVVEGICGLKRWDVRLTGVANHAGTTPMLMRSDAFQGLAEFSVEIDRILEEHGGPQSVATIGRVELQPGAANVVPGEARFALEFRDLEESVLYDLSDAFRRTLSAIARRRGLMFDFKVVSELVPVSCDQRIRQLIESTAQTFAYNHHRLPSGAAHDTQQLARITRTGMIFVPSKDGRSHSAAEWTSWNDIQAGANVLLNTLYDLANEESP
ncbi:MAG: Zn-dependent hydrolase [Candidatus Thiodiazotropha sp. (ex Ctena orbiculata)]|nr:Zn-dependent hydrolase [Candidatus Thiodiazotropha taylori]